MNLTPHNNGKSDQAHSCVFNSPSDCALIHHYSNEFIMVEGESPAGVFCVCKGQVKIMSSLDANRALTLWIARQGDMVGLHMLIDSQPCHYSAYANGTVSGCFVPPGQLLGTMQTNPSVLRSVLKHLSTKVLFVEQRMACISRRNVRVQCAIFLLSMATAQPGYDNEYYVINYTITDIAGMLGVSTSALKKILEEFASNDILSFSPHRLVINNIHALEIIAYGSKQ